MKPGRWGVSWTPWVVRVRCERGLVRKRLEDAWAVLFDVPMAGKRVHVAAVFDGLGGEPHGDQAAAAASEGLAETLRQIQNPDPAARELLLRLNKRVMPTAGATTAVIAIMEPGFGEGSILHVGDSSAYRWDGQLRRITRPDSGGGNLVSDYLGNIDLVGHATKFRFESGALVLCTDGVDGVVGSDALEPLLRASAATVDQEMDRLFAKIEAAGAPDNATLVWVRRESTDGREG